MSPPTTTPAPPSARLYSLRQRSPLPPPLQTSPLPPPRGSIAPPRHHMAYPCIVGKQAAGALVGERSATCQCTRSGNNGRTAERGASRPNRTPVWCERHRWGRSPWANDRATGTCVGKGAAQTTVQWSRADISDCAVPEARGSGAAHGSFCTSERACRQMEHSPPRWFCSSSRLCSVTSRSGLRHAVLVGRLGFARARVLSAILLAGPPRTRALEPRTPWNREAGPAGNLLD